MAAIFVYEVEDEDGDNLTRLRVLQSNDLELEVNSYSESSRIVMTPRQATELASDLRAAARVARTK